MTLAMRTLLGFSTIFLHFLLRVQAAHVVLPFHLKKQLDGDRSSTHCNEYYGGLLPYRSITQTTEREIFRWEKDDNQSVDIWVTNCPNEEKRQGSCYQATIIRYKPVVRRCSRVPCYGIGHVVCLSNNTDLTKTTESEKTINIARSTILSQISSFHVHLIEKNDDTIPTTGTALKVNTSSTAFLPRRVVLKYIVIPFTSVILIVLIIVIIHVWLLKRKPPGRDKQRNTTQEYYNTTSEDPVPMERKVSNHIYVYAEPENAHIIPSTSADYVDINDCSAYMISGSEKGKAAEASYRNVNSGGGSKDDLFYPYAPLPIVGTLTKVDITMEYSNMAATGIDVADSAGIGQRANHSRSLAVTDKCYVNTQLK